MSFRELRSFTEKMRVLSYPHVISIESFKTPNFPLVADILFWLAKNYDSNLEILYDISTEQDRIIFIKSITSLMASKAHIKLNTRKLYMADGYAVKELLKITNALYDAVTKGIQSEISIPPPLDISSKFNQIKQCRSLASEITEKGSSLYELLEKEISMGEERNVVISKPLELQVMQKLVNESIAETENHAILMQNTIENLASDEKNLQSKIEKKKQELDRAEKRLKSLQGVRPAYMDEYEKIEIDLVRLYEIYMERFRNLTFLEQQLDDYNKGEMEQFQENEGTLKKMQDRIREEEMRLLRGNEGNTFQSEEESMKPKRPSGAGRQSHNFDDSDTDTDDNGSEGQVESNLTMLSSNDIIGYQSDDIKDRPRASGPEPSPSSSEKSSISEEESGESTDDNDF